MTYLILSRIQMKLSLKIILTVLIFIFQKNVYGQATVTLCPDPSSGKDALLQHLLADPGGDNANFGNSPSLEAMAWTWSGQDGLLRSVIEFDLSSIPSNAIITDARL